MLILIHTQYTYLQNIYSSHIVYTNSCRIYLVARFYNDNVIVVGLHCKGGGILVSLYQILVL